MKIFLDTGDIEEIKEAASWGIIDGVTTNPSLIAKTGKPQAEVIKTICSIIDGPISAEVIATERDAMIEEALILQKIHPNVVIKLPMTEDGISACNYLNQKSIKVNVTLCFSAGQALLAAKSGATFISPFIGRLDDIDQDGMELIRQIRKIYDNYSFKTQILAASIRHDTHVRESALAGADAATIPTKVAKELFNHHLTTKGLEKFLADHKATN